MYGSTGALTGVSTPRSASSLRPLVITHGPLEHALLIPTSLHFHASSLRERFLATLPAPTEELASDDEPASAAELVSKFLGYVAEQVETGEDDAQGTYEEVLKLVLSEFEGRFLRGNEVHAVAAGLPGTPLKRQQVVKAYYSARQSTNRPIKTHDSALFRAASDGNAAIYAIFGGQGTIEEYFQELREVYTVYNGIVEEFISVCASTLSKTFPGSKGWKVYSKGLDVMRWLQDEDATPDLTYLVSAPVSLPIIGLVQLAHYYVTCHSQGIITAAALATATTWESFVKVSQDALTPYAWCQDLSIAQVQRHVDATNTHLPEDRHIHISLINGAATVVVTGPPQSLYGLNLSLRKVKAPRDSTKTVSHSQSAKSDSPPFLPISAPFHSPYLSAAASIIDDDLKNITSFSRKQLGIPLYETFEGKDLRQEKGPDNLVPELVRMVTNIPVHWEKATVFPSATHIIDFGLVVTPDSEFLRSGTRRVLESAFHCWSSRRDHCRPWLQGRAFFDRDEEHAVKYAVNWVKEYGPTLVRTKEGKTYVDTKFSRLLGRPPVMVAGMTPCTVPWDFVAATINAGYHVELAGGGYYNERGLTEALQKIEENTTPEGVPLLQRLRAQGVPIEGMTIGAGVSSIEVANEYIETLGLKHIAFKPGSVDGIQSVINIAKANPTFPVILQWTANLQMYGRIRRCQNIILLAGSGFGGAEDTYPYITGAWSRKYNYPPMPFDGVLFGSRMMTAKEAHTSHMAKKAITEAEGVEEKDWEKTYKGAAPIHKLATRGVKFWAEMDRTIFSLDKAKRIPELKKQRDYIIKRLNADFQKVWFGRNSAGQAVDLEDMTYAEVVRRMVELMYRLTGDFIRRVEERLTPTAGQASLLQNYSDLDDPFPTLINAQDMEHFLLLCQRPGQKPVTFVPSLDENFEFWFKKDSLWQSEDLSAVVDQDYSTVIDEPIKDILDNIHISHTKSLLEDLYAGDEDKIPVIEYLGGRPIVHLEDIEKVDGLTIIEEDSKYTYRLSSTPLQGALPEATPWYQLLAGKEYSWRHALFTTDVFVQGNKYQTNPMKRIFAPAHGLVVEISNPQDPDKTSIVVKEPQHLGGPLVQVLEIKRQDKQILVTMFEERTVEGKAVGMPLIFTYHPEAGYAPIREVMEGRNDRIKDFYYRIWFGDEKTPLDASMTEVFDGGRAVVTGEAIADFVHAVGNNGEAFVERPGKTVFAPMDFAIVVGWKAIIKAIFPKPIDGDLLRLVHLSNSFRMLPGAEPLKKGDVVDTTAQINAVLNQDSGKMVEVCGTITRDGKPVMEVISQFLYRGTYTDFENTFQRKVETPMQVHLTSTKDVAALKSREWFSLDDPDTELINKTLTFRLSSFVRFKNKSVFSSVETVGQVLLELPSKEVIQVASVEYSAGESHGNPVIEYLQRHGSSIEQPVNFENPIPLHSNTPLIIRAPASNEAYARVSGDYNPIHVSGTFSKYADLKGTITHGMFSSAAVRSLVETWAADNDVGRMLLHVGMVSGRKIIKVETINRETEEKVLIGEAEVEQPVTAYIFTGQGSQEQGMGMDLYQSSPVARAVWDRADKHFMDNYGFAITHIVKNNPKEFTVHFGGARGKAIRQNYMSMTFESVAADGTTKSERIFKDIDEKTASYTYRSPTGLLSATQFTQPALTLMEKASFEDMVSRGLVQRDSAFAGHSLGEYSALAALAEVMPIESLVSVVFYRGLTMQVAVERDESGRSNYSMCAVNPSRVSSTFSEQALQYVVDNIAGETGWLLEVVNYNVANQQYVCAGDLRALDCLTNVLNFLKVQKIDIQALMAKLSLEDVKKKLGEIIQGCADETKLKPQPIELQRGLATIPLRGIDVPFHSTFLRSGVKPFRSFLMKKILKSSIDPSKLVGKYIPNVTAKPFQLTKEYFEEVYKLTNSPRIGNVLANWDKYEDPKTEA
ncbi:acyl transferase domain-containing protein [Peziza echinospora]|nr:acyl transferase domain-containing protein [Peziza echinospora]